MGNFLKIDYLFILHNLTEFNFFTSKWFRYLLTIEKHNCFFLSNVWTKYSSLMPSHRYLRQTPYTWYLTFQNIIYFQISCVEYILRKATSSIIDDINRQKCFLCLIFRIFLLPFLEVSTVSSFTVRKISKSSKYAAIEFELNSNFFFIEYHTQFC